MPAILMVAMGLIESAAACQFCVQMGVTLAERVEEAQVVVEGELGGQDRDGNVSFRVRTVIKGHPAVDGRETISLARIQATPRGEGDRRIVFASVSDGQVVPFRSMPVGSDHAVAYLVEAVRRRAMAGEKLGFFFGHLDDEDPAIAEDAYKEFAKAPNAEVAAARERFDRERIIGWLDDPATPRYRIGLYGLLLGLCGGSQDAALYRRWVDPPARSMRSGLDGLLAGYCLVDPQAGPAHLLRVVCDSREDFGHRYAALRAIRFVLINVPSVDRRMLFDRLRPAIAIEDQADLVIDEFRRGAVWKPLEEVLRRAVPAQPDGINRAVPAQTDRISRAALRFCVACPDPKAQRLVEGIRAENAQLIEEVLESLRFEKELQAQFGRR